MLPLWCFSAHIFSAVLGYPLRTDVGWNNTSEHDHIYDAEPRNNSEILTKLSKKEFCNITQSYTESILPPIMDALKVFSWLPTMHIHQLDGSLRPGDEKSVDTSSPHSPGKK
ncbi:hypothetical protein Q7C36_014770 [Tachysurus vachellii]|uniref:Uncharacterized protein n=1 Tax=Tachysurus vachellii TaxID=175792 RepID=A0AA88MCH5_TACVA|nr:hypothetical protein Q7C36_014770 [Tachysurus vachellii]